MRKNYLTVAVVIACLSLASCSSSSTTQPEGDLSPENIISPEGSDEDLEAARIKCLSVTAVSGRALRIVSTVAPITNLVGLIAGDVGPVVKGVVPEGINSHTFEPPPSASAILEQADIIFVNGLKLEDPTLDLAKANAPKAVICELGTSSLPQSSWLYDFSFPKESGKPNPHLWTNPLSVMQYVTTIRDVLVLADPLNIDKYEANYVALSKMVMNLDAAMKLSTATVPANDRKLLTYHDAYAYFALRYGYEVIGAIQPQSFEEPSPRDIAALIDQVKAKKVKAVFGSEVFPSPVLEQIGKEAGVRYIDVLRDDDLPGDPGDVDHSWAGLMKFNYITIVEALGGDATALKAVSVDIKVSDKANYPQ